jgi:osmotically-inducible protein OsmY
MKPSHFLIAAAAAVVIVQTAGCAVARDQQSVGSYIDDTTITTRVFGHAGLDPAVSAMSIQVETLKGTVQLSGFARNSTERSTAEKLAAGVPGVLAVRNDIVVR